MTAVALDATSRTCAPVVGAGLDRVAHAFWLLDAGHRYAPVMTGI